jgi:hypothetical protein
VDVQLVPWYQSRTIITALAMGVVTVLRLAGVVPPDNESLNRIIDALLALGAILVVYLRVEPSPAKAVSDAQRRAFELGPRG